MPRVLSPAFLIRNNALYRGVLGPSKFWKAVAVVVFGRGLLRQVFGKHPDVLGTEKLRAGQSVTITSIPASTRAERKQAKRARRRRARRAAASTATGGVQVSVPSGSRTGSG